MTKPETIPLERIEAILSTFQGKQVHIRIKLFGTAEIAYLGTIWHQHGLDGDLQFYAGTPLFSISFYAKDVKSIEGIENLNTPMMPPIIYICPRPLQLDNAEAV